MTQQQETVTKQKNPLRIEQGKKLVEYNKRKKDELKRLNEQITKQDDMVDHKPKPDTNTYVYTGSLSVLGLAIGRYLLYSKFKKPERKLIDVPAPPVAKTNTEPKRYFWNALKFLSHKYIDMVENYTKDLKESVYHGAVVSALAVGYSVLGKTLTKISPPSLSNFDAEDAVKLVAVVAMSDFTKGYLIRQKILPSNI